GGNGGAGDKRLEIRLLRGWDGYAVDQTVAALSGCGFVFRVGRRLVGVQRGSGGERPEVVELSAGNAVQWLPRAAGYFAPGKEGELLPCNVPGWLARAAVEAGVWPGMPELLGVSCAPMLRADGSFSAAVGFDAATGYFVDGAAAFPALPARVTETEALAALAELRELVAEFPFATVAAEASWLALVLTLVSRHLLAAVPAVFVNGTAPGAGKSLLVRVASIIHKGDAVGASVFPRESEELAKALLSELLTTPALVFYDNLPAGYAVASPELCAAITTSQFSARLLGSSTKATVPARAVFAFTGNNAGPAADMVRRSVIVRLELPPESEAPREFRIPALESHTLANWRRLHAAALMFLAGFIHAGRPGAGRLAAAAASFEEWGGLVRASLVWALGAEADPWATQALARDADEETGEGFALVCEIARALRADRIEPDERPREFLARDLRELALRPENNALRELLESRRRGSGGDVADVREIGRRLRSLLGRWVPMQAAAGRVSVALHQAGTRDHTAVFAIVVKLAAGAA
nr:hypothetical protein [Burkholderiales bacterium]